MEFDALSSRVIGDTNDPTVVAEALGRLGPIARDALPSLRAAATRTYADYCNTEAHDLIADAILRIESMPAAP